jgi:hypothetical protein
LGWFGSIVIKIACGCWVTFLFLEFYFIKGDF